MRVGLGKGSVAISMLAPQAAHSQWFATCLSHLSFNVSWSVKCGDTVSNDVVEAHCYIVDIGQTDRE